MAARVRRLGPDDWELYRRIRLDMLKEAPYAFGSTYEREVALDDAAWRRRVTDRVRFLAEVGAEAAGTVSGGDGKVDRAAAMTAMWVAPRFRRHGVGDLLVKTLIEWAREAGYREMFLWVAAVNERAERLYLRNSFTRTGAVQDVRPGEHEFEMSRPL